MSTHSQSAERKFLLNFPVCENPPDVSVKARRCPGSRLEMHCCLFLLICIYVYMCVCVCVYPQSLVMLTEEGQDNNR